MQPTDITLVPLDADEKTLKLYLDASPLWTYSSRTNTVVAYRHDGDETRGPVRVFVPVHDDPDFAPDPDDDRQECARTAYTVNAVALGLPANTSREAVRRLVEIANLSSNHKPGTIRPAFTPTRIHAVATGQEAAR
ncbi:hypothetical protein [Nonomuraea sp. JJY05]|uniref:hypothetical protein n=1 Tax=Nonomuraea sp. JJY05 TaxID=3350255 RepID=UPI00373E2731